MKVIEIRIKEAIGGEELSQRDIDYIIEDLKDNLEEYDDLDITYEVKDE